MIRMTPEEAQQGAEKRQMIINDAQAMKRLLANEDFTRFLEMLREDREGLNSFLLNEENDSIKTNEQKTRIIARINQIDRILKKPHTVVWQMKNLTEIREAIKEQTLVRQAHGNKTGGR